MKIRIWKVIAANKEALVADRKSAAHACHFIAAAVLALGLVGTLDAWLSAAVAKTEVAGHPVSPEIQLVEDYNAWFLNQAFAGDLVKIKAGLPKYITNDTVLHEAASLPWGGTMVGYDGWVRLVQTSGPIFAKITSVIDISQPKFYQHGNVVLHELTMTIKSTAAAPDAFVMGILEKYTIENGRIKQIDEFYADTAGLLERLRALGAISDQK